MAPVGRDRHHGVARQRAFLPGSVRRSFTLSDSHLTSVHRGDDYVRGSLNWGPFTWLNGVSKTFGWWNTRRSSYDAGFHTYSLEWTDKFLRIYVDTRLHHMLDVSFNEPFFTRGDFPPFVAENSTTIATPNPWLNGTNAAPFDKPFYLIMNVAVGGTNGWFPDGVGDKPWIDQSVSEYLLLDLAYLCRC